VFFSVLAFCCLPRAAPLLFDRTRRTLLPYARHHANEWLGLAARGNPRWSVRDWMEASLLADAADLCRQWRQWQWEWQWGRGCWKIAFRSNFRLHPGAVHFRPLFLLSGTTMPVPVWRSGVYANSNSIPYNAAQYNTIQCLVRRPSPPFGHTRGIVFCLPISDVSSFSDFCSACAGCLIYSLTCLHLSGRTRPRPGLQSLAICFDVGCKHKRTDRHKHSWANK